MIWTPQQDAALAAADKWLKSDAQVFRIFGYAGTGKTTLAKHLASQIDGETLYGAYTGKAASVMRASGCDGATTLHSLLYSASQKSLARVTALEKELETAQLSTDIEEIAIVRAQLRQARREARKPNFNVNDDSALKEAALLVVDEVSMVNDEMKDHILSINPRLKVLVLGDPAQLPPVQGTGAFMMGRPDILLTDIQRQAKDNPIVRWATMVREGQLLPFADEGRAKKISKGDVSASWLAANGGQLLTGRNETRRKLNRQMRDQRGFTTKYPDAGEPLVCLRNNHDYGLLNGTTSVAVSRYEEYEEESDSIGFWLGVQMDDGRILPELSVLREHFDMYWDGIAEDDRPILSFWTRSAYQEFDYGYALTVHKSQGSQWERVTVCDDGFGKREPLQRQRWLYTAITRAQHELVILA